MANLAQSICSVPADKGWTYVRDTLWQNLKKTAMIKIDNAKKTGTGEMENLTEVDNIVLEIIGKDSPVICGLGVAESFEKLKQPSCETVVENNNAEYIGNKSGPISAHETPSIPKQFNGKRKRDRANNSDSEKVAQINQEKLVLQVEYLRLKNHKTKLEIVKLEQELKLPMSEFTASLSQYNGDENG